MQHLKGKAAVVTGAGRGIGRAIALEMARQGASVIVVDPGLSRGGGATDEDPASEVVAEIRKAGGKAESNRDSVAEYLKAGLMIKQCVDTYGKIDILVNVAGNLRERMIWNMSEDDFDAVIAVHLKGNWNTCHHAVKYMRAAGHGRIINFSSDAFKGSVGQCNYSAAKAGIIGLTRSIAKEAYKNGITANAICPSADTRMTLTPEVKENRRRKFEAGLMTKEQFDLTLQNRGPEYIAPMVAFLATDGAYYINGQLIHVERGRINTEIFGDDFRFLHKWDNEGMFTVDELIQSVPNALMSDVVPVVPVVKPADAVSSTAAKKEKTA